MAGEGRETTEIPSIARFSIKERAFSRRSCRRGVSIKRRPSLASLFSPRRFTLRVTDMHLLDVRVVFLLALIAHRCYAQNLGAELGLFEDGILGSTGSTGSSALSSGLAEDLLYPIESAMSALTNVSGIGQILQRLYSLARNLDVLTNGHLGKLFGRALPCTVLPDWSLKCDGIAANHGSFNGMLPEIAKELFRMILEQLISRVGTGVLLSP